MKLEHGEGKPENGLQMQLAVALRITKIERAAELFAALSIYNIINVLIIES